MRRRRPGAARRATLAACTFGLLLSLVAARADPLPGCVDCADCQDHVQPFNDIEGYPTALKKLLIGERDPDAYVIWMPWLFGESAVQLRHEADEWRVRYTWVDEPVWNWEKGPDGKDVLAFRTAQPVQVRERSLSGDLAERVVSGWRDVLRRTRAQQKRITVSDGVVYSFYADGLVGQDANVDCGAGGAMLDVAKDLANYAGASDPISRWGLRVRLRGALDRLERNEYETD